VPTAPVYGHIAVLSVLDRNDVVAARNRLERHYGMRPLPISDE
jgi:hypothetical protein